MLRHFFYLSLITSCFEPLLASRFRPVLSGAYRTALHASIFPRPPGVTGAPLAGSSFWGELQWTNKELEHSDWKKITELRHEAYLDAYDDEEAVKNAIFALKSQLVRRDQEYCDFAAMALVDIAFDSGYGPQTGCPSTIELEVFEALKEIVEHEPEKEEPLAGLIEFPPGDPRGLSHVLELEPASDEARIAALKALPMLCMSYVMSGYVRDFLDSLDGRFEIFDSVMPEVWKAYTVYSDASITGRVDATCADREYVDPSLPSLPRFGLDGVGAAYWDVEE